MSDLSRLLDDLYALPSTDAESDAESETSSVTGAEVEPDSGGSATPTRAPDWSSEEALDEVFATWVPGPAEDASGTQRSMVAEVSGAPASRAPDIDSWLQETEPVAVDEPVLTMVSRWSPSDDDIFPAKRARANTKTKPKRR